MKIKALLLALLVAATTSMIPVAPASADTWVNGYTKKNGTYVQGHFRSRADGRSYNNYTTKGNVNPYTGKKGTVTPNYWQLQVPSAPQYTIPPTKSYSEWMRDIKNGKYD